MTGHVCNHRGIVGGDKILYLCFPVKSTTLFYLGARESECAYFYHIDSICWQYSQFLLYKSIITSVRTAINLYWSPFNFNDYLGFTTHNPFVYYYELLHKAMLHNFVTIFILFLWLIFPLAGHVLLHGS